MLGCQMRGYSFTRALLGIAADELHLCGDPAAVPLIQEILKVTGDEIEVPYIHFNTIPSWGRICGNQLFFVNRLFLAQY